MDAAAERHKPLVTEALLIAASPFVGYLLTYIYDVGYLEVFNAPAEFISLGLNDVLWWSLAFFGGSSLIFGALNVFVLGSAPGSVGKVADALGATPFIVAILLAGAFIFRHHHAAVVALLIYGGSVVVVTAAVPLIAQRRTRGYRAKWKAQRDQDLSVETYYDVALRKVSAPVFLGVAVFLLTALLSFALGTAAGLDQTKFLVDTSDRNEIVLRQFSDRTIWATLDPRTRRIVGFAAQPLSADHPVRVRRVHLGHIKGAR